MNFSPSKPIVSDEVLLKIQELRSFSPASVTSDIANIASIMCNKSSHNPKTMQQHLSSLIDKLLLFVEFWNQKEQNNISSPSKSDFNAKSNSQHGGIESQWKDHDELELSDLIRKNEELEFKIKSDAELILKAKATEAEASKIAHENSILRLENQELIQRLKEIQKDIASEMSTGKLENKNLKQEMKRLEDEISTLNKTNSEILGNRQVLQEEIEFLKREKDDLLNQIKVLEHDKHDLQVSKSCCEEELHTIHLERSQWNDKIQQLNLKLQAAEKYEASMISAIQAKSLLESQFKILEGNFNNQKKLYDNLASNSRKREQECKDLLLQIEECERRYLESQKDIEHYKAQLQDHEQLVRSLTERVNQLQISNSELIDQIATLTTQLTLLTDERDLERRVNQTIRGEIESMSDEKMRIMQAFDVNQRKLGDKEEEVAFLQAKIIEITNGTGIGGNGKLFGAGITLPTIGNISSAIHNLKNRNMDSSSPVPERSATPPPPGTFHNNH